MRLTPTICVAFSVVLFSVLPVAIAQPDTKLAHPIAQIELYNPTEWKDATVVKVRCGDIASPQAVDWRHVQLRNKGTEVPFALCEGKPHWKSDLRSPVGSPQAEDLLIFACPVPPGQTTKIDVVLQKSTQPPRNAVQSNGDSLLVTYPNLKAIINRETGLLTKLEYAGKDVLKDTMFIKAFQTKPGTISKSGNLGGWRGSGSVRLLTGAKRPRPVAQFHSSSSTKALSEIRFILSGEDEFQMGLTYRVHSAGLVEILADGRPWKGKSPWIDKAVQWTLNLSGSQHALPYLENRLPAYGFKEYFHVVHHPANIYAFDDLSVVELGEEILNGRRWHRQLYFSPIAGKAAAKDLAEIADEGFVIKVTPHKVALKSTIINVQSDQSSSEIGQLLVDKLNSRGLAATVASSSTPSTKAQNTILLSLTKNPETLGLSGDGFQVAQSPQTGVVTITSGTLFGLTQAVLRTARDITIQGGQTQIPCIASNPTSPLRAVGPGGGLHEVDFPYGTDKEWLRTFDSMIESGVNTVTCLGMWSNWKMPVSYRYMPEIFSTAPDAYDEITGTHLKDVKKHRKRGLKFAKYLRARGVQVWLWVPVGCVPTTFAEKYPEAMCKQSKKTPNFAHPKYQQYLDALVKELLETYPIDGVVMIRDDNGEICREADYMKHVKKSRTKDPIWEQYLGLYDMLRKHSFKGDIAVYPYGDFYMPRHESVLPDDLMVVGHGSGLGMLCRDFENLAPMGDTWLDNMYSLLFQLPPAPRMKRLLSDRSSFWLGGAFTGTELPWDSVGYFGWNADATPNSLRYEWGRRVFGEKSAKHFVRWSDVNEHLWDVLALSFLPGEWTKMTPSEKISVATDVRSSLEEFSIRLNELQKVAGKGHETWFQHVRLCPYLVNYRLTFLENADQISELISSHQATQKATDPPNTEMRNKLVKAYHEIEDNAEQLHQAMMTVPGNMISSTIQNRMTRPWIGMAEALVGMGWYAQSVFNTAGMSGGIQVEPLRLTPGKSCTLRCRITNTGFYPWTLEGRPRIILSKEAQQFGFPKEIKLTNPLMVYGDTQVIEINGTAPQNSEVKDMTCTLEFPKSLGANQSKTVELSWTDLP